MQAEMIEIDGKIGKLYFSHCPNCKKYIVIKEQNVITCSNCKKKYEVQYPEG